MDVLDVSEDECLTNSCIDCEIALKYPEYPCQLAVLPLENENVVVFRKKVSVFKNQVGEYTVGSITTRSKYIYIGGDYMVKLYIEDSQFG